MARVFPNGTCWCGCGAETGSLSFFLQGHDKYSEAGIILMRYGGVPELLADYGYGPGGKNLRVEFEKWKKAGGKAR